MNLKLQNKHLKDVAEFLQNTISVKGKKNIHRMRVVKTLQDRNKEVGEEELTLLKEYAKTGDDGELQQSETGGILMENSKEFNKQQKSLYDEYFTIEGANLESALKTIEKLVNDYDKELSGKDAEAHFVLAEAFEENTTEEEQE